jgi:transcriptional regulator with XRE-family HTH domain
MDWNLIRRHYAARLAKARHSGLTQQAVATAGQLPGQNAISKLLANHNLGPSVETFVKAVAGLGVDVSAFFAEIEQCGRQHDDPPIHPSDSLEQLHAALITARFEVLDQRIVLTELLDRLGRIERSLASLASGRGSDGAADQSAPSAGPARHQRARGVVDPPEWRTGDQTGELRGL